tara:strand:- start:1085 stop:1318 length:234 start_codon:yes stop_codon:yes gene_type:complete
MKTEINGAQISYAINSVQSPDPQGYAQGLLLAVQDYLAREGVLSDSNNSAKLWISKKLKAVDYIIEHELQALEGEDA